MAVMNSKASILTHVKVGLDCPQRGTASTQPREAFGVRRIPALSLRAMRNSHKAPEYGALQTLRALSGFSLQRHSKNLREKRKLLHISIQRARLRFAVHPAALRIDAPYHCYILAL